MQLDFKVEEQTLRLVSKQTVVADSLNYLTCKFEFSSEWDNIGKTAVFVSPTDAIYTVILENDGCEVPWEVIQSPSFQVSVFGGDRITANLITVNVTKSGYFEGDMSQEPTPDVYTQILDRLNKVEQKPDSYELIQTITVENDGVTTFTFDKDLNGNSFKLNAVVLYISCIQAPSTSSYWKIGTTSDNLLHYFKPDSASGEILLRTERMGNGVWAGLRSRNSGSSLTNSPIYGSQIGFNVDYVETIYMQLKDAPAGTKIKVYGRRAT